MGTTGATEFARVETGLRLTNILDADEQFIGYLDREPWHPGGAETYIADGEVFVSGIETSRHVIAKALVSMGGALDARLASWLRRRELLSKIGIPVPRLYSAKDATIFEEFIDFPITAVKLIDEAILDQVGEIGAHLDFNGFSTLSFVSDLRIKNGQVLYVDFGFDLGEPSDLLKDCAREAILKASPTPVALDRCLRAYDVSLRCLREEK
jgi:hypothetical protein